MTSDEQPRAGARELLGRDVADVQLTARGGNSRIFRVLDTTGHVFAVKQYRSHAPEGRDRLDAEYRALELLARHGVGRVPLPVARHDRLRLAAYEFIDGEPADARDIDGDDVDAAVEFVHVLADLSRTLPYEDAFEAAEARFSFREVVENIETRARALLSLPADSPQAAEMHGLVRRGLLPKLDAIARDGTRRLAACTVPFDALLPGAARILSPSDFGFHNAVRTADGGLIFVDFEYFGWDDPAKLVCDFLLHPGMDLSATMKRRFVRGILRGLCGVGALEQRLPVAYSLFALKWCVILLNGFLPGEAGRRRVGGPGEREAYLGGQLDKSRSMLERARTGGAEYFQHGDV